MDQTRVYDSHNADLLALIPKNSKRLIEVGCSSGALAREFKSPAPEANYSGIEIDLNYAELAKRFCNDVAVLNIEKAAEDFWRSTAD